MIINEKVSKALNRQVNAELFSSYLYLSMAAYFESINLSGFGKWLKTQSSEEYGHAMKLYSYIIERGGRITLAALEAPKAAWKSPLAAFEEVYAHELKITALIAGLVTLAREEKDYPTEGMLQWFVNEQVEEESSSYKIVEMLKAIKDSANGLFMLNHELGERK